MRSDVISILPMLMICVVSLLVRVKAVISIHSFRSEALCEGMCDGSSGNA